MKPQIPDITVRREVFTLLTQPAVGGVNVMDEAINHWIANVPFVVETVSRGTVRKVRFENKASATAPASNNRLSEFLRTFPTVIELSTVRLKTGSVVETVNLISNTQPKT
jgi:hypothetical protein